MFMWPLQTHFCLLSSYVYVSKTCTRTAYSLWILVEFGDNLRFSNVFLFGLANLQSAQSYLLLEESKLQIKSYMDCIFKIWEVEMLTELNIIVNGIVKIHFSSCVGLVLTLSLICTTGI